MKWVAVELVGGACDDVRDGVIGLPGDQVEGPAVGVAGVDLSGRVTGEVGERGLDEGAFGRGDRVTLEQLIGFGLFEGQGSRRGAATGVERRTDRSGT
jgi:hypothetical protein